MNNTLHKNDIVDKVSEKLKTERIEIGGNKYFYKRKYHLMYSEKIIRKVLDAFWSVVAETIEDGDSVKIYNYMTISPKYYKEREVNSFDGSGKYTSSPRYKIKVSVEGRLKEACKILFNKVLKDGKIQNE